MADLAGAGHTRRFAVCRSSGAIHRPPDAPDDAAPYPALMTSRLIDGEEVSGGMLLTRAILGAVAVLLLAAAATDPPTIDPAAMVAELVRIFMSF